MHVSEESGRIIIGLAIAQGGSQQAGAIETNRYIFASEAYIVGNESLIYKQTLDRKGQFFTPVNVYQTVAGSQLIQYLAGNREGGIESLLDKDNNPENSLDSFNTLKTQTGRKLLIYLLNN